MPQLKRGGILAKRRAKVQLARGTPGCGHLAYESLQEAIHWFEKAEAVRPPGNDDTLLRWEYLRTYDRKKSAKPARRRSNRAAARVSSTCAIP
jgi:hypothetical protein